MTFIPPLFFSFQQQTNLCECRPGFTGVDCANATSALTGGVKFAFSLLSIHQENVHSYFFKMYGSTMESYNEKLYIFGNGELMDSQGYFLMFDLMTNTWASPFPTPNDVLPNNRVFHCSFVFQVSVKPGFHEPFLFCMTFCF